MSVSAISVYPFFIYLLIYLSIYLILCVSVCHICLSLSHSWVCLLAKHKVLYQGAAAANFSLVLQRIIDQRERGLNFYWLFNKLSVQTFQLGMCINLLAIVLSFRSLGFVKDYWFLTFSRNLFSSKLNKMRFNLKVKAAVSSHFVTATTVYCFSAVSTDCCISGDCNTSRDKKKSGWMLLRQ